MRAQSLPRDFSCNNRLMMVSSSHTALWVNLTILSSPLINLYLLYDSVARKIENGPMTNTMRQRFSKENEKFSMLKILFQAAT